MTAPKAPPREVWVVCNRNGSPCVVSDTEARAIGWCLGDSVHRYLLATAVGEERERVRAEERRDCMRAISEIPGNLIEKQRVIEAIRARGETAKLAPVAESDHKTTKENHHARAGENPGAATGSVSDREHTHEASPGHAAKATSAPGAASVRERATADCLCRDIDPSDQPCIVCEASDELGILRPANAMPETGRERTGEWVLRHGNMRGQGGHWPMDHAAGDFRPRRFASKALALAYRGSFQDYRPVALTRRVRRGP